MYKTPTIHFYRRTLLGLFAVLSTKRLITIILTRFHILHRYRVVMSLKHVFFLPGRFLTSKRTAPSSSSRFHFQIVPIAYGLPTPGLLIPFLYFCNNIICLNWGAAIELIYFLKNIRNHIQYRTTILNLSKN